jgi:hypothetical protein
VGTICRIFAVFLWCFAAFDGEQAGRLDDDFTLAPV